MPQSSTHAPDSHRVLGPQQTPPQRAVSAQQNPPAQLVPALQQVPLHGTRMSVHITRPSGFGLPSVRPSGLPLPSPLLPSIPPFESRLDAPSPPSSVPGLAAQ